jgi:hypothetical protein
MNRKTQKAKAWLVGADEVLPEYDFSDSRKNAYASGYAAWSSAVVLKPNVAADLPMLGADQAASTGRDYSEARTRKGRLNVKPRTEFHDVTGETPSG